MILDHRQRCALADRYSHEVIGAAIETHRWLGPGLLESAYEECLSHELGMRQVPYSRQVTIPLRYKGVELTCGYRADLLIDTCLLVEIKAVEAIVALHQAQVLTYLRLLRVPLGLIINFNVPLLSKGIKRLVNGYHDPLGRAFAASATSR